MADELQAILAAVDPRLRERRKQRGLTLGWLASNKPRMRQHVEAYHRRSGTGLPDIGERHAAAATARTQTTVLSTSADTG